MRKTVVTVMAVLMLLGVMVVGAFALTGCAVPQGLAPTLVVAPTPSGGQTEQQAQASPSVSVGPLSDSEIEALTRALDDEHKALATYQDVLDRLGQVRPFTNIAQAEQTHIDALVALFERYDLPLPEDRWDGLVTDFGTVKEACEGGVQAEVENVALYDELFSMVGHDGIVQVFTRLQVASQEQHLPAFERCAG